MPAAQKDLNEFSCHENFGQVTSLVYVSSKCAAILHIPIASTQN